MHPTSPGTKEVPCRTTLRRVGHILLGASWYAGVGVVLFAVTFPFAMAHGYLKRWYWPDPWTDWTTRESRASFVMLFVVPVLMVAWYNRRDRSGLVRFFQHLEQRGRWVSGVSGEPVAPAVADCTRPRRWRRRPGPFRR